MKKFIYLLAIAGVAATVACSKTQLIQPPPEAEVISFRPLMNGMTKATPKTGFSENETINVWATMGSTSASSFFNSVTFTYTGSGFSSSSVYYWPSTIDGSDHRLDFYASSGVVQTAAGVFSFTPESGADLQTDLLVSKLSVSVKPASAPALTFKHALTQIEVQAKNGNSSAVTIDITGVKLGYVATTGSCDFTSGAPVWTITNPTDPTAGYTQLLDSAHLPAEAAVQGTTWMIVPQNVSTGQSAPAMVYTKAYANSDPVAVSGPANLDCAYVALELAFYNAGGSAAPIVAKQWCYWPISINLQAGNKYTFVIDAATGGYQPGNTADDGSTSLDRVLEGLAISFGTPEIEIWVTTEGNTIPVVM